MASDDDPFFSPKNDDKTIIRPVPGGRQADIKRQIPAPEFPSFSTEPTPRLGQLNPLEKAASGLLALITRINLSRNQANPEQLKSKIISEIEQFQLFAHQGQIDHETISSARYVLCTVLDEAIINTPWGNQSNWAQHSLLSLFHKEVSGGERFFHLLKSLAQNPGKNLYLLELMYICLTLGFEGRYRLIEGGKNKLVGIREWLYQILQKERGNAEQELSVHWQGVTDRRNPLLRVVPFWVFSALTAAMLASIYSVFLYRLNNFSDPVFKDLYGITPPQVEYSEPPPPPPVQLITQEKPPVTLSILLANEIANNQLSVKENNRRSIVTIQGDNLFAPGSSTVNDEIIPLLNRIAESLDQLPGQVLITGHSDNKPIRSARYPSNWHLSKARAETVADVIKQNLAKPNRITIAGKSDLNPIASNATPAGRAKNRRVEVTLLK